MLRGKRCPLPGLKVKLATGQVGTVVKAPTPKGRTTCDGPGVFVRVGNRTFTVLRGELSKATKRDVKAASRLENFGPTPQLGLGVMTLQRSQRELPPPRPVTNLTPISHRPRTWNEAVALVERGQATWRLDEDENGTVLVQDRNGRTIVELDTVNLRVIREEQDLPGRHPHRQFGAVRIYAGQNAFITLTKVRVKDLVKDYLRTQPPWVRATVRFDNGDPRGLYVGFFTGKESTSAYLPRDAHTASLLQALVSGREARIADGVRDFRVQITDRADAQALSVWLDRAMQGGQLGRLGIEWTGASGSGQHQANPDGTKIYEDERDHVRQMRFQPELHLEVKPPWSDKFFNGGLRLEDAKAALKKAPASATVIAVPEWNSFSSSYVHVNGNDGPVRHKLWNRSDLEQLLAAEDHYRGIMPPETQFRGLGAESKPVTSKYLKVTHWETNGRQMLWVERRVMVELHRYTVPLTHIDEPTEYFYVRLRMVLPGVRVNELPRYKISLVELKRALTNGSEFIAYRNETWAPSHFRIDENRRQELLVWLDSLEGVGLGKLGSSDAEHATAFDHARFEAMGAVNDAAEALKLGQCRIAGSLIDQGYINYGRMEANAMTPQHMGIANAIHKLLRTVDEPFEKQCVRPEPVSESHARTLHAMRPGLAGRK